MGRLFYWGVLTLVLVWIDNARGTNPSPPVIDNVRVILILVIVMAGDRAVAEVSKLRGRW